MQANTIEVRKSEIAAPAKDGRFEVVDGPTLVIQDDPRVAPDDIYRLVWLMTVA
jgi:hypothetical protein